MHSVGTITQNLDSASFLQTVWCLTHKTEWDVKFIDLYKTGCALKASHMASSRPHMVCMVVSAQIQTITCMFRSESNRLSGWTKYYILCLSVLVNQIEYFFFFFCKIWDISPKLSCLICNNSEGLKLFNFESLYFPNSKKFIPDVVVSGLGANRLLVGWKFKLSWWSNTRVKITLWRRKWCLLLPCTPSYSVCIVRKSVLKTKFGWFQMPSWTMKSSDFLVTDIQRL